MKANPVTSPLSFVRAAIDRTAVLCILLLTVFTACDRSPRDAETGKQHAVVNPPIEYLPNGVTRLTGGILEDRCRKNMENLYMKIDKDELVRVFEETHDPWYAEPEFVGHYLTAAPFFYKSFQKREILERNREIVAGIIRNQPESGYLGTYHEGLEFDYTFSVWNQNFVIKGLLAHYEWTGNEKALEAAMKCADYLANAYLYSDTPDILYGLNQGIQHATILEEIAHLYRLTGKKLYLDFAEFIIKKLENSTIKVITVPNKAPVWAISSMIGCTKGIEMFIIYFGVLEMYRITGDEKYLDAAKNYWSCLRTKYIRQTGNGTIGEHFNFGVGNTPVDLSNDLKPNENCVAMGWMKFSAELARYTGESKYFDELEKTLYNHLIGAQALDGSDFSYYQGNFGYKIHQKDPGQYSCCRYRGMKIMSYLPGYVYMQNGSEIMVNLYTPSATTARVGQPTVVIDQETRYPKDGEVNISVETKRDMSFDLLLRKPGWCEQAKVTVDGEEVDPGIKNGYMVVGNEWTEGSHRVRLELEMKFDFFEAEIEEEERLAVKYGPLMLAVDSRYATPAGFTMIRKTGTPELSISPVPDGQNIPQVKFLTEGRVHGRKTMITLVDYASAGSQAPGIDEFRMWIPSYSE